MSPKVKAVKYRKGYFLDIVFVNNEEKTFDLKPYLSFPVYEKLRDESYCARAKVQDGVVVWDEETDIDPDRLYLESVVVSVTV